MNMMMNEMTSIINDEQNEFLSDFKHFAIWPTNQLTDRPTDQPTNGQSLSYRGAKAHLIRSFPFFLANERLNKDTNKIKRDIPIEVPLIDWRTDELMYWWTVRLTNWWTSGLKVLSWMCNDQEISTKEAKKDLRKIPDFYWLFCFISQSGS